jgi:hypothetical protein
MKEIQLLQKVIAVLISDNQENYAVLLLTDFLQDDKCNTDIKEIIDRHAIQKYMSDDMIAKRNAIKQRLFDTLKSNYSEAEYDLIRKSF